MIGTAIADTDIMAVQPPAQPNAELPLTSSCRSPLRLGRLRYVDTCSASAHDGTCRTVPRFQISSLSPQLRCRLSDAGLSRELLAVVSDI